MKEGLRMKLLIRLGAHRTGALAAMGLGVLSLAEAVRLFPYRSDAWAGDHLVPGLLGALLLVLGALMLRGAGRPAGPAVFPQGTLRKQMLLVYAAMLLYTLTLPYLGYLTGTWIAGMLLLRWIGGYRWVFCLPVSAAVTAVLHVVFVGWLQMSFPAGIFTW
ncbi:hypothetical protein ERY13_16850 [Paenibacillus mucilaginosus]|nr:hypothetical protein ERY13_16850 [Paenibacillus mucilaginosus]